jgi:hypothetical protein
MSDRPRRMRRMACAVACGPRLGRPSGADHPLPAGARVAIRHCRPTGLGWL